MRLARPEIRGPTASPQRVRQSQDAQREAGLRPSPLSPSISLFFSGDRTAPPLSPLRWASEAPGRQRAAASRPARRLPPRLGSHAPSAHSPGGPRRQGQRPPAPLPRPARAPLQPRAALGRRGMQRRRGPRAAECELAVDSGPLAAEPQGVWQPGGTSVHGRHAAGPHHYSPSTQHPMAGQGGPGPGPGLSGKSPVQRCHPLSLGPANAAFKGF